MIPAGTLQAAVDRITGNAGNDAVARVTPVGGGCINAASCLQVGKEKFFLKWNDANKYPGMFAAEAQGLELLRKADALHIPQVLETATVGEESYILMEWIEAGRRRPSFWSDFGRQLAKLHKNTDDVFGLQDDNYIGSLKQSNLRRDTWREFFMEERLQPQLRMALDAGKVGAAFTQHFNNLFKRLDQLIPDEPPALLHGDLWNGNFLVDEQGNPCLMDPAVYYGHREMDLAMTRLFGGFEDAFYNAYQEEYPLEPGFEQRLFIHNLYPLLVHVNLFGGGYVNQVKDILSRF